MANNNFLSMNEDQFQSVASEFEKSVNNIATAGQNIVGKFSGATNAGLMGETVGLISRQMNAISGSLENVKSIMVKHSNEMFDMDRSYAEQASAIEIPTDFVANNSSQINSYNRTILGKIDGRSVNEGQVATAFNEIDESTIAAENLTNITGVDSVEETYDDSSVVGRSVLSNISGDQTQEQTYDDKSSVNKVGVTDINTGAQTEQQSLDESTVIGKSTLGNVNNNNVTQQQEMDDISSIAASVNLSDISGNENSNAGKTYDDMMLENQGLASTAFATMVSSEDAEKKKNKDEEQ